MILQPMGRTATPCYQVCGELLPRLFTLTPSGAVIFCYVVLNVAAYRPLTGMEPYAARTFLSRVDGVSDRRAYCARKDTQNNLK